jgi:hypothetical protein
MHEADGVHKPAVDLSPRTSTDRFSEHCETSNGNKRGLPLEILRIHLRQSEAMVTARGKSLSVKANLGEAEINDA